MGPGGRGDARGAGSPRDRGRGRAGLHVPLPRDRGAARGRRLRGRRLRPAVRSRAARGHERHLPRRRLPRGVRRGAGRQPEPAAATWRTRSRPACRRSPSAPGCSTSPRPSTASTMAGVVPVERRHDASGSRCATRRRPPPTDSLLTRAGERVTGHEFHRTATSASNAASPAWEIDGAPAGFATDTWHASYLHVHWAGHPRARPAVRRCGSRGCAPRPSRSVETDEAPAEPLRHHGDVEARAGLLDFAVNVYPGAATRVAGPRAARRDRTTRRYPDAAPARGRDRAPPGPAAGRGAADRGRGGGVHPDRADAALAAPGRGAPAVHRAARRARAGGPPRRHRPVPARLHPRPRQRPGRGRPGRDRQPHQPDRRPAPGVR